MIEKKMVKKIGLIVLTAIILIACESEVGGSDPLSSSDPSDPSDPSVASKSNLYAWGLSEDGQFGRGNTHTSYVPVQIRDEIWSQIAAGGSHSAAIRNGELYTWGKNDKGQLGNENTINQNDPVKIGKNWIKVSISSNHTAGINIHASLFTWGDNSFGQLGDGGTTGSSVPARVGLKTWAEVSLGFGYTVAIDSNGKLYAWGKNDNGQLGIGNTDNQNVPVEVVMDPDTTKIWNQVSVGASHSLAIDDDNKLYAWGKNENGQLGIGNETDQSTPVAVVIGTDTTKTWKEVSAGGDHSVAIDSSGTLYVWGKNDNGQLGNGESGNGVKSTTPIVIEGTKTWTQVSAGGYHSVALDSDGALYTWGKNDKGQLGIGIEDVNSDGNYKLADKDVPVLVSSTKMWEQVSAGENFTLAIIK